MIVRVLPLPAPAKTSSGPSAWVTACIWGSFSSAIVELSVTLPPLTHKTRAHVPDLLYARRHAPLAPSARAYGCERRHFGWHAAFARGMRLLWKARDTSPRRSSSRWRFLARRLLRGVRRAPSVCLVARVGFWPVFAAAGAGDRQRSAAAGAASGARRARAGGVSGGALAARSFAVAAAPSRGAPRRAWAGRRVGAWPAPLVCGRALRRACRRAEPNRSGARRGARTFG